MKCQYVKWIDSASDHGWVDVSELSQPEQAAHTVGFLLGEDDEWVIMALSYDPANDQVNCYIKIPKAAVKERRTICQIKI